MTVTRAASILGTRGVPARHGGFETFAERLSAYLVSRGWRVTVYCQCAGSGEVRQDIWNGVHRVSVPVSRSGAMGTIFYDWKCVSHALRREGIFLTLGYNTAIFNIRQRLKGQINIINMDGMEWKRNKWGPFARSWLWLNEWIGCRVGNHLVADHPKIKEHLSRQVSADKISMIPYGADAITTADVGLLARFCVEPGRFSLVVARPEPENSFLEIVRAFSRVKRGHKLVVLGALRPERDAYHRLLVESASSEVIFAGAIYDRPVVDALRYFCYVYLHGHRVGGTNPSLVEAMGAGCAVVAHENEFNRWVAGAEAAYFNDDTALAALLDRLLLNEGDVERMKAASRQRFLNQFTWPHVLNEYENLLTNWCRVG